MWLAITIVVLFIIFFTKYRLSYPLIVVTFFVLNHHGENDLGLPVPGIGLLDLGFIIANLYFFISLYMYRRMPKDKITNSILFLLFCNFLYCAGSFFAGRLSPLEIYRAGQPLVVQLHLFSAIIYLKKFGSQHLYAVLYKGTIVYLIVWSGYVFIIPFRGAILGLEAYHFASVGLASAYIVAYKLIYLAPIQHSRTVRDYAIIAVVCLLPFLGMGRGGIFALVISFLCYLIYKRQFSTYLYLGVLGAFILLFSNELVSYILPDRLLYFHQGASDLRELFSKTSNIEETIGLRLIRWGFLIEMFKKHPLFGGGLDASVESAGLGEWFRHIWQGHNFYLSILGGGGLFLFLPNLLLLFWLLSGGKRILFASRPVYSEVFGLAIALNAVNINLTNTYFVGYWAGTYIWVLYSAGLYELYIARKIQENE